MQFTIKLINDILINTLELKIYQSINYEVYFILNKIKFDNYH